MEYTCVLYLHCLSLCHDAFWCVDRNFDVTYDTMLRILSHCCTDHCQIWHAYVKRSGKCSNLTKCAPCMARKGGLIGANLRSGYLSEPLRCVGSGTASSASRYYRKGNACDHFSTNFNDTKWVHSSEPERSRVTSQCFIMT